MNGVRSISMRKGYLLTALAAAVLLAASSGTAYAQSIGFSGSRATIMEGASPATTTPAPITITINISGLTLDGDDANRETGLGQITLEHDADYGQDGAMAGNDDLEGDNRRVWVDGESSALDEGRIGTQNEDGESPLEEHTVALGKYGVSSGDFIPYDNNGVITLVIIDPAGDGNWVDNKFSIKIESSIIAVSPNPGTYSVTVRDDDVAPVATFSKTSFALTEETETTAPVSIAVGVPKGTKPANTPAGIMALQNQIRFTTSPAGAAVMGECVMDDDDDVIALTLDGITSYTEMMAEDTWQVTNVAGSIVTATIGIEACGDMSGFNDDMVTFSFVDASLVAMPTGYGSLGKGADLVVTVRSEGEDKPTVTFATTSIAIDEGDTNTVAIIADGKLGPEVGSVMVSMSGDAMVSLWQGMDMLEAGTDGMYAVDLGGSANTILTISADGDAALEDGMTSSATLTIESANGALIGDRDSLTVTVSGSTAVAALPLLAQLLLALFLMAGGARLYRRRNG